MNAAISTASRRPLVISGPSGCGKSTILKKLFADYPNSFGFSVSHTTRKPRSGELDGREYNFVTRHEFEQAIKDLKFIEHAEFGGNLYGTSIAAVQAVSSAAAGKICILDIERNGVESVKKTDMNALFVYIKPPSIEELKKRLKGRGTESEETFEKRMATVEVDMEYAMRPGSYDKIIVNDDLETAYGELKSFLISSYADIN
eukprot:Partr_v1_DN25488_c0_g1_i1_m53698 putative guanylate kinase